MHTLGCLSVGCFRVGALWDLTPLYVDWQMCLEASGRFRPRRKVCVCVSIGLSAYASLLTRCFSINCASKLTIAVIKKKKGGEFVEAFFTPVKSSLLEDKSIANCSGL